MLGGAVAVLASGQITVPDALGSINADVMVFLLGMFIVGEALVESGYLSMLSSRFLSRVHTTDQVIFFILFGMGLFSAVLMNDTLAVIGTPLVLSLATKFRLSPKLMLLSLALAITTGSVMSPIGNPQNLLVAVNSGMETPFVTFGVYLLIPTIISLGIAFILLRLFYPADFPGQISAQVPARSSENTDVLPAQCALAIILILAVVNITASFFGGNLPVPLPAIAICAAVPVLLFGHDRVRLLKNIDWSTLVFFAALFVLMESVWQTRFFSGIC
jgi:Na+/H+ antiporter NhaD/arsenite permease-like protein